LGMSDTPRTHMSAYTRWNTPHSKDAASPVFSP
jgi:hypothetical protein